MKNMLEDAMTRDTVCIEVHTVRKYVYAVCTWDRRRMIMYAMYREFAVFSCVFFWTPNTVQYFVLLIRVQLNWKHSTSTQSALAFAISSNDIYRGSTSHFAYKTAPTQTININIHRQIVNRKKETVNLSKWLPSHTHAHTHTDTLGQSCLSFLIRRTPNCHMRVFSVLFVVINRTTNCHSTLLTTHQPLAPSNWIFF